MSAGKGNVPDYIKEDEERLEHLGKPVTAEEAKETERGPTHCAKTDMCSKCFSYYCKKPECHVCGNSCSCV